MRKTTIKEIQEGFDALFHPARQEILTQKQCELFATLGIEGFAEPCFYSTQQEPLQETAQELLRKTQQDLLKLSYAVYRNLAHLPLQRNVQLPTESGAYKFIISSPSWFQSDENDTSEEGTDHNSIHLLATDDDQYEDIVRRFGLEESEKEFNIFGGGRIEIDFENESLSLYGDEEECVRPSFHLINWMMEAYEKKGFDVQIETHRDKVRRRIEELLNWADEQSKAGLTGGDEELSPETEKMDPTSPLSLSSGRKREIRKLAFADLVGQDLLKNDTIINDINSDQGGIVESYLYGEDIDASSISKEDLFVLVRDGIERLYAHDAEQKKKMVDKFEDFYG